ncbi:unnamed protein product, partial [marine sediment metagenome]
LAAQAKLLQFLESLAIERLGETRSRKVDVRVIAASNKELQDEVQAKRFREDLYYRLNVIDVHVPPLRTHREDISELVEYFLEVTCQELGIPTKTLEEPALKKLRELSWPGNVRQLRNTIEKAISLTPGLTIRLSDLPELAYEEKEDVVEIGSDSLQDARKEFERRFILQALEEEDWNMSAAAERLGLDRTNLYRKIKALKIKRRNHERTALHLSNCGRHFRDDCFIRANCCRQPSGSYGYTDNNHCCLHFVQGTTLML